MDCSTSGCPSLSPAACSNSCPLSRCCHPTIHLIFCRPLLLLPSIFPSIRVFSNESALCVRWPNCWSFSFSISPSNEYSGLISFRMDWLDLLAVQRTLKSLLHHHSSKAPILQGLAFFMVQLSPPSMIAGKTIALTRQTFVGKVMCLFFNMLSRFDIAFLPRSKHLLISWLQSLSTVILEPKKIVCHHFHCFPIYLPWSDGTMAWSGSDGKASACNAGDLGSIPGLGRSPGEGNGNPLQYSCLENSMDREAW